MSRGELLLEVRAEEIPARMLSDAARFVGGRVFEELMTHGMGPREVETAFTPRRLVLVMKGLPEREPDREEEKEKQVQVTLTSGFWLGKYEVTQGQWEQGGDAGRHHPQVPLQRRVGVRGRGAAVDQIMSI